MTAGGRSGGDHLLIAALAAGQTYEAAAQQAGVSERTVRRRLDDPAFRQAVDDVRAEMLEQTTARLTSAALEAVDTLRALLGSDLDFARLGAARALLEVAVKYREQHDLAERIAALEAQLPKEDQPRWPLRTA